VDWLFRRFYRHCRCYGFENVPDDGAVIYSPNHQNGLMDALAVLQLDARPKVFVARADIFRKPRLAKILTWLKIMPINRIRDGVDSVRHNDVTMQRAVETLRSGVPFCIMPEGTHRRRHSLLPLQKGIFRIALQALEGMPQDKPLYIVPVGLDYADWYHQYDDLTIRIGEPIDVGAFASAHPGLTEPQLILALREELTARMQALIPFVPDDADYDRNWADMQRRLRPAKRFPPRWLSALMVVLLAPLALFSALFTLPLWAVPVGLWRKVKDPAFRNSILFVWVWLLLPWLLFTQLPFWLFLMEYLFHARNLRRAR